MNWFKRKMNKDFDWDQATKALTKRLGRVPDPGEVQEELLNKMFNDDFKKDKDEKSFIDFFRRK
jgi:hypothetical protein